MLRHKLVILKEALQDIDSISDHLILFSGAESARKTINSILDSISKLEEFPYMGARHNYPILADQEYRKLVCGEYVAVYKVIEDTVFIYRIVKWKTDYIQSFE